MLQRTRRPSACASAACEMSRHPGDSGLLTYGVAICDNMRVLSHREVVGVAVPILQMPSRGCGRALARVRWCQPPRLVRGWPTVATVVYGGS
jgi:hypothetical protein